MYLKSLDLQNFRNFKKRRLEMDPQLTLIQGDNGTGKTNIFEAVYLLATGKSFRAQLVEEMVNWEAELGHVSGNISEAASDSGFQTSELAVTLTRGELEGKRVAKRRFRVDGAYKRRTDFMGRLICVLFNPQDLQLILGSPSGRREFFDNVLSQIDRDYRRSLVSYEKAISRRNKLLDQIREGEAARTQLAFWNQLLIKHGQVISNKRDRFVEFINNLELNIDSFTLNYKSSRLSAARMETYQDKEIAAGYTLAGPHKDDFQVTSERSGHEVTSRELAAYGSRGEQRLAVLWLRLSELEFISQYIDDRPILLLDDIFSELDFEHRKMVLDIIPRQQTLISTTDIGLIQSEYRKKMKTVELRRF